MIKPLSNIKPLSINEEIYSPTDLSDLELSIRELGQLEPIVINSNDEIISIT
jgi:ParB-like chromosome segregation protein Spo0J